MLYNNVRSFSRGLRASLKESILPAELSLENKDLGKCLRCAVRELWEEYQRIARIREERRGEERRGEERRGEERRGMNE